MEQKKTLWIIAASGVFLLVVLGAALLLNSTPSNVPTTASITTIDRTPATQTESIAITPITTPSVEQNLDSNTLAFQKIEEGLSAESNASQVADSSTTNIELNTTSSPSSNVTATSRAGEEALAHVSKSYSEPEKPKAVAKAPAKKSAPVAKAAPKPAPANPLATKYWVQAASFTNKKSADNARTALDDNKIPAEVFTYKDAKDSLFYRVRVGPYTTKSEAEYWKTRIASIDLFKDTQSYVTAVKM